jgi:ribosomal protein S18 acetylase RimI-like enzyme
MVAVNLRVRRATPADQSQIANLMYFEPRVHRHLDWRPPLDWLGSPHYWVLEEAGDVLAALACPQDPPGIAWVRLFTCASPLAEMDAWSQLWETARNEIALDGSATVAAIAMQPWFEDILVDAGFRFSQNIIMLEWQDRPIALRRLPAGTRVRRMQARELPGVVDVDWSAFEPLWRNSRDALQKAYSQAIYATVAENSRGLVGYQLSTGNPLGAHLARLAVRPEMQGAGIGAVLVGDLLLHLKERGKPHVTVNTQSDNLASQALYQNAGFRLTGERYPVFTYPI